MNTRLFRSATKGSASPVERPQGSAGEARSSRSVTICHYERVTFDDRTDAALLAYAAASAELDAATDDAQLLHLSDMLALAALNLRKALTDAGWSAPVRTSAPQ
ncbi:MAG: hypothetical protein JWO22_1736 [Frankiales bacterium]|nr:hypothetical protein [Frankiales bacterium]